MANEVVKYKNELNLIAMKDFTATEMDLFFAICSRMKEQENRKVRFEFDKLRALSHYKPTSKKRFADDLERTYDKMLRLTYGEEEPGVRRKYVLFTGFKISIVESYVDITINQDLLHILNRLESQFTRFELEEFTKLRGSYAKTIYRLLKQFKSTGYYKATIEIFRELLDIPDYYKQGNIDQKVLGPALVELEPLFEYIRVNKIKSSARGGQVTHIEITFAEKKTQVPLFNWLEDGG